MLHSRFITVAVAALALPLTPAVAHAALATMQNEPTSLNDLGMVSITSTKSSTTPAGVTTFWQTTGRWSSGTFTSLLDRAETNVGTVRITESGTVYAYVNKGNPFSEFHTRWPLRGGEVEKPVRAVYETVLLDDAGRTLNLGNFNFGPGKDDARIERDGTRIMSHSGVLDIRQVANDGAFIVSSRRQSSAQDDDPLSWRVFTADNRYTEVPDGLAAAAVAPGGAHVATSDDKPELALFLPAANGAYSRTNVPLTSAMADEGVPDSIRVNHGGRIVAGYEAEHEDGEFTSAGSVWTWVPGGAWRNITDDVTPPGIVAAKGVEVVDVNEWGDILVQFRTSAGSPGGGNRRVLSGALVTSRTALIGQISTTAATSGRAKAPARSPLQGKTVTLSNGVSSLSVKTNAAGRFKLLAPSGAGYSLTTTGGACIVTANGCHVSTTLPTIADNAKPVNLAKTAVPNLATLVNRRGSVLPRSQANRVATVTCRAAVTCRVWITIRSGRTVYGTGAATILRGKTKRVIIKLNRAATRRLSATARTSVGATLAVRAGALRTTTTQSFILAR